MTTATKLPITHLALPPQVLQHHLNKIGLGQNSGQPGPSEPTPNVDQRRSRSFAKTGHWARVTPLPLEFPYRIQRVEPGSGGRQIGVEEWLGRYDDYKPADNDSVSKGENGLSAKTSQLREAWRPELLGVSEDCLKDDLPHLDVGNALEYTGQSSSSLESDIKLNEAGQALLDVISGRKVMIDDEVGTEYGPWSSRYAGHQFGSWAGQLGDGRAISILETYSKDGGRQEIQLKGSGRTPFSRSADGLAVLRSGVREYLCAEAMAALQIPTSRSLALLTHPEDQLQVQRENGPEPSSLLARLAPSFVRIGNFEILNPPEEARNMQFFMLGMPGGGGGKSLERDLEGLRVLGEWVAGPGGLDLGLAEGEAWGKKLLMESALRNARMVAAWQVYGFCHGVINTDNVSVLGLTIDYGPYAFMDVYDPFHICNHSDHEGRYDYRKQPSMILFAIAQLSSTLAEAIGAETETGKAIGKGWADVEDQDKLEEWRQVGLEFGEEVETAAMKVFKAEYQKLYSKRFGLLGGGDELSTIVDPFLSILATNDLDFHSSFRALCRFKPSMLKEGNAAQLDSVLEKLVETAKADNQKGATDLFKPWLKTYAERIKKDQAAWAEQAQGENWEEARSAEMRKSNPRFVLRQWILEETIAKLERGEGLSRRKVLGDIMKMATNPFETYGGELAEAGSQLSEKEKEEKRLCGMGPKGMLGFQCSCSS